MTYTSRIPEKVLKMTMSETDAELDTAGLDALIKASGNISVKPNKNTSSDDAYILSDGETLEFTGKIYVSSTGTASLNVMLFKTV